MAGALMSIVIPACNEAAVIHRTLNAITAEAEPGELELIVVCNGCSDDTARIARQFSYPVRVIETAIGSKVGALNLGDEAAHFFPRAYVDADVIISIHVLRALVSRLAEGDVYAVAPRPEVDLSGCSRFVRAYFNLRAQLPSCCEGVGGSGVYVLSAYGRGRFLYFPEVIADDGFVRIQFKREERETLSSFYSTVFPPRRLKNLVAVRARAHFGNYELYKCYPDLWKNIGISNSRGMVRLVGKCSSWPGLLIYVGLNIIARGIAKWRIYRRINRWERDDSSRSSKEYGWKCSSEPLKNLSNVAH